jgi:hypothetical protein
MSEERKVVRVYLESWDAEEGTYIVLSVPADATEDEILGVTGEVDGCRVPEEWTAYMVRGPGHEEAPEAVVSRGEDGALRVDGEA